MSEAKGPCIKCGCTESIVDHNDDWQERGAYYWVTCLSARCRYSSGKYPSREAAVAAWNDTPLTDSLRAQVEQQQYVIDRALAQLAENTAAMIEARAQVEAAKANTWQPVVRVLCPDGMDIHADAVAITIGSGDTAMATAAWPVECEYAVCKRQAAGDSAQEVERG